jgi:hypothetical protein
MKSIKTVVEKADGLNPTINCKDAAGILNESLMAGLKLS